MMCSEKDLKYIQQLGISLETIEKQLSYLANGFAPTKLVRAASKGDGLEVFDEQQIKQLLAEYDQLTAAHQLIKFVPASGAASRMFKTLFECRDLLRQGKTCDDLKEIKGMKDAIVFFDQLKNFAFFDALKETMTAAQVDIEQAMQQRDWSSILDFLLTDKGLNYGERPKALLDFHRYSDQIRTPLEEHLVEGAGYAAVNGQVYLHFTVSPEHLVKVKEKMDRVIDYYEKKYQVTYHISYSVQDPSTDTIAVDMQNEPIRNAENNWVFRQGGHGALIKNLEDLQGDIVFIKNIDNVTTDALKVTTYTYKKVIGSYLLQLQKQIFRYLNQLENVDITQDVLDEIMLFAADKLGVMQSKQTTLSQREYLYHSLNRPIRVCGMVRNEGEPGGGPFWVEDTNGCVSLQIVETSQINLKDENQKGIVDHATHFNPVDLVCGVRDYKGKNFDLKQFIDPDTGFISQKSFQGKDVKALELPGLWNGAMAHWITIFVEVPVDSFSPVKTVNDLLRKEHQTNE